MDKCKIISRMLMSKSEGLDELLELLDVVQRHADLNGCQHCDKILKSVFENNRDLDEFEVAPNVNAAHIVCYHTDGPNTNG
ncbi:MAG TPA: hypothetical protein VH500_13395 [Nitrososphaeraceae archaeon]